MASNRLQRQIERLLDEAEQALTDRDWDVVRLRARDVLAFDPENTHLDAVQRASSWKVCHLYPPTGLRL